ncbi:MAG: ankyrin repeat domain-containing protein [Vulcanimicrobiota bacterium]
MMPICAVCQKENRAEARFCDECGRNLSPDSCHLLDNRYEIIETIKSGGMGCVYKARDVRLENIVALKKMLYSHKDSDDRDSAEQNFKKEAKLLSYLHHGGLPKVIDYFSAGDPETQALAHYLVMTHIGGRDTETLMLERDRRPFPAEEGLSIFWQILDILKYLHSQDPPVIYRDLKPSNIMEDHGRVFLVDFGIAQVFSPDMSEMPAGTSGYCAPEQMEGAAEARSDLYSLGAVMYYLLTGKDPQKEADFPRSVPPPIQVNKDIPHHISDIIMKMLEQDSEKRPLSAEKIMDVLNAPRGMHYLSGQSMSRYKDIFDAVKKGDYNAVRDFLSLGIGVNVRCGNGSTLLHYAVWEADIELVELLISRGADVNARAKLGWTPLHRAAQKGRTGVSEILLKEGADVNAQDDFQGKTPLHDAALGGHVELVRLLIEKGAAINKRNKCGHTPLHEAARVGHKEVMDLLIRKGANTARGL